MQVRLERTNNVASSARERTRSSYARFSLRRTMTSTTSMKGAPMTAIGRITCPHCLTETAEVMPENACLYFFECPACHALLRPRPGDCCVFCSYGDTVCPPRKVEGEAV